MIIGITGGTGCGKTTALNVIRDMGGTVIDCDAVYHQLLQSDKQLLADIEARFPGTVENGQLQRKKLGAIVFADPRELKALTRITGGAIRAEVLRLLTPQPELAAIDAIGLIEGGYGAMCDVTVAVTAPKEVRIARLMVRDGITGEYAAARIAAQKDEAWFRENCDHVLVNDGTQEEFREKCLAFFRGLGIMNVNATIKEN